MDKIPKCIVHPATQTRYTLIGCVLYEGTGHASSMGHYKALVYRRKGKWYIYDDMREKAEEVGNNIDVVPAAILFCSL